VNPAADHHMRELPYLNEVPGLPMGNSNTHSKLLECLDVFVHF
jgi:hypothetical protein